MTTTLHPELRRQLATLLTYCREIGATDFYRGDDESPAPPQPSLELTASIHSSETASIMDINPMPRTATLSQPPVLIDFDTPPPVTDRAQALRAIQEEIGDCTRCALAFQGRNKIVFGDGDPNAELMFVGEGPGADEDMQGLPFVGRGGQLLNNMIAAMGLRRQQVYIANIVKCRPPKNRVPEPAEANTCTPFLFRQIAVIRPKLIVALGSTAATYLLATKASLSILRGKIHDSMGTKLIVTYHPAYLLRDPRQKAEAWKDLQLAMKFLGLSPPPRARTGDTAGKES